VKDKLKVGYLVTARLKSTRLPRKLLLKIKEKSVISHMLDRLKLANNVDEIIICTSTEDQDRPLGDLAKENNVKCFFGNPDDVLTRLLGAADEFDLDYILNITADCPFVDPIYADKVVEKYLENDADLIRQFDLPHGVFSYGIKVEALRKVVKLKDSSDTEVWGRYFTDTGLFNVVDLDVKDKHHNRPGLRMTLDYPEDLEFFKAVFDALYVENKVFSLTSILDLLDAHPEIIELNKYCGLKFNKRFISQSEPMLKKLNKVKTALIIGSGSIGQRHIRNLRKLGISDIITLRSKKGHFKKLPRDLQVIEIDNWHDAIRKKPDIAVISNPTSLHLEAASKISQHVKGVFIEKPLSHSMDGCQDLIDTLLEKKVVSFVGYNLMFHPIIKKIIKFYDENDVGEIINIQCMVGQWLPDWHPYEDYKKSYFARKDLGGGVALTLIHEIHLAIKLAGLPIRVSGEITGYKKLDLDVDVCSDLMLKHKTGSVSQIHLDYLQQPSHRSGLVTFEKAWLGYDFNKFELTAQRINEEPQVLWNNSDYDSNQMYVDQLKEFIRFVEEGRVKHQYDAISSVESLKVVDAFFKANKSGKKIDIEHNQRFSF
jgi:spore coat polysaccharide biosynthesis protein SpsF